LGNYLEANVVVPIQNREIYENSGLLEEKVPKGLVLNGKSREGILSLVQGLRVQMD